MTNGQTPHMPSPGTGNPPQFGDLNFGAAFGILPAVPQDPPMVQFRGTALHHAFDLRTRLRMRDKPMLGMWYGAFPHVGLARVIGQAGFDYVVLDWEHTPYSIEQVCELIKTIQYGAEGNTAVIVRVPSHEHYQMAWLLDAGASGLILPHTETVEQAKAAVKNARFPTHGGVRSQPPNALLWGYNDAAPNGGRMLDVWARAAVIMQIESRLGADNAADIAAVEGVDGLMVGPGDLALDLQVPLTSMFQDETFISCIGKVVKAAKDNGLGCMMPGMNDMAVARHLDLGFTMVMCSNDGLMITRGLRQDLNGGHEKMEAWKEKNDKQGNGSEGK